MMASVMSQGLGPVAQHLVSPRAVQAQITRTATTPAAIATMGSATSQDFAELGLTVVIVGTVARTAAVRHHTTTSSSATKQPPSLEQLQ